MDGPIVPNWAWAEYIQPLGLPTSITDNLLPTAVGTYQDEIYAAGYWDAALSIFARKSVLDANGIRIPTIDEPWTIDEFDAALATLKAAGYDTPLDIGAEDKGEWWSYAYSPMLQSAGGDLIDRDTMLSADGALNGPEAVAFFTWFQDAFANGSRATPGTIGNQEFNDDEVALSYTGVWNAMDSARGGRRRPADPAAAGLRRRPEDRWRVLAVGHLVELRRGRRCARVPGVQLPGQVHRRVQRQAGGHPRDRGAAEELSANFGEGDPLRPFVELSQEYALARPATPAYPVISSTFEKAAKDIMSGADVQSTLDGAVQEIDTNISSNDGYGF